MKRYIKSSNDIFEPDNRRFDGDYDERVSLVDYTDYTLGGETGYVELVWSGFDCYVDASVYSNDDEDFYKEFKMSDIDSAIEYFNQLIKELFHVDVNLTRKYVEQVMQEYGASLDDYAVD